MKKALALVLALVLALSLGVSAFAASKLTVIDLEPAKDKDSAEKIKLTENVLSASGIDETYFYSDAKGGVFYVEVAADGASEYLKNVEVTAKGNLAAEIVEYNPDEMEDIYGDWVIVDRYGDQLSMADAAKALGDKFDAIVKKHQVADKEHFLWVPVKEGADLIAPLPYQNADLVKWMTEIPRDLETFFKDVVNYVGDGSEVWPEAEHDFSQVKGLVYAKKYNEKAYDFVSDVVDALNSLKENRYNKYSAAREAKEDRVPTYLVKVTVEPNYSASYKTGSFKVNATNVIKTDDKGRVEESKKVTYTCTVISDVSIFEYELVKWAGAKEETLVVNDDKGYSDFLTDVFGYGEDKYGEYSEIANRAEKNATVISTTGFRALREAKDGISVKATKDLVVSIPEIGAGQKGVNFSAYGVKCYNAKGKETSPANQDAVKVAFGFNGNQVIASDFTVTVDLDMDAYELRKAFGERLEEEDIITYYIVEDGKVAGQFTVDYMSDDLDEVIVLEINRKAGSTLGEYEIVLEAPSAPSEGEENPDTGAESVIGVVAAMAVVSVAAAAAVSLKK